MKNKNEKNENKFGELSNPESYEEMPMQNYNPCMYFPISVNISESQLMPNYLEEASGEQEEYRPYPGPEHGPGPSHNYGDLINQPVGVSLTNGQGVSGILCSVTNMEIYLLEYLYHSQFATKHYPLNEISDIYRFPKCQNPR